MQFVGFGNGSDGVGNLTGTDAPNDTTFAGTAAATSGTGKTGMTVAAGALALIIQMRGTGVGAYEIIQVESYTSGTGAFAFTTPLVNTYTDSGNSQAQLIILKQYSEVNITGTFTAKAWDGDVGGVITFMCAGKVSGANNIVGTGKGFRGTTATTNGNGWAGEGSAGAEVNQRTPNGNGGGGAAERTDGASGAGGAGHSSSGTTGQQIADCAPGQGGNSISGTDGTTLVMGGGGGEGGNAGPAAGNGGDGGNGGAILLVFCYEWAVTGTTTLGATNGTSALPADPLCGGGGAGSGGDARIVCVRMTAGSSLITAPGGSGGSGSSGGGNGGGGSAGRIRIEACYRTGTTTPAANEQIGGQNFCSVSHGIL